MHTDRQLAWVYRNGQLRRSGQRIGRLLPDVMAGSVEKSRRRVDVARALAEVVDEQFRRQCRVASLQGGVLTINVDSSQAAYAMHREWLMRLSEFFTRSRVAGHVRVIRFRVGTDGIPVARSPQNEEA